MDFPCRTCMQANIQFTNIFNHVVNGKALSDMLMDCAPIEVKEGDGLPHHICKECTEKLTLFWNFRESVLKSESKLRNVYNVKPSNDWDIIKEEPGVNNPENVSTNMKQMNEIVHLQLPIRLIKGNMLLLVPNPPNIHAAETTLQEKKLINSQVKPLLDYDYQKHINKPPATGVFRVNSTVRLKEPQETLNKVFIYKNRQNISLSLNSQDSTLKTNVTDVKKEENQHNVIRDNLFSKDNATSVNQNNDSIPRKVTLTKSMFSSVFRKQEGTQIVNIRKPPPIFCKACDKTFSYHYYHQVHVPSHTASPKFKCDICNKSFLKRYLLKKHSATHTEQGQACDICGKVLKTIQYMRSHKLLHTVTKSHICNVCNKGFKDERLLSTHTSLHTSEKNFMCELCGKSFVTLNNLKTHKTSHNTERTLPCPVCGKLFSNKRRLQAHSIIHREQKPHVCEHCNKAFRTKKEIKRHMLVHVKNPADRKQYSCKICGKMFKDSSSIPRHMLTHTGETPYSCDKCPYKCKYKQQIDKHMKRHK